MSQQKVGQITIVDRLKTSAQQVKPWRGPNRMRRITAILDWQARKTTERHHDTKPHSTVLMRGRAVGIDKTIKRLKKN